MPRSYLVLDIETVPDPALWVAESPSDRSFPPLHAHRPVVLGVLWLDEDFRFLRLGVIGEGKTEKGMLEDFSAFVCRKKPDLITYNGRSFDLPVLALRSLRHGIPMSWYYEGRVRNRNEEGHVDLCDLLSSDGSGGTARPLSLDAMARVIGLPGKVGVDGSQVEGLYRDGQLDAIKSYCLADVAQTGLLFLRFRLLQGQMAPEAYRRAAADLMDVLRADGRLGALVQQIDGERLLLAA